MFTEQTEAYLEQVRIPLRLACLTPTEWPTVVSLWFLYRDGLLCCATQRSARVVQYLQTEPRCGFEIAGDQPPYCGIRGRGIARIDYSQGGDVLRELLLRYQGSLETPLARKLMASAAREVAILIEPNTIYRWDYSNRMIGSPDSAPSKICP